MPRGVAKRPWYAEAPDRPRAPVEHRCAHGFVRSVATCVECDSAERGVPIPPPESDGDTRSHRYVKRAAGPRPYRCSVCGVAGHSVRTCKGAGK